MHFAQTLDAGVIPEWKSQYIDFNEGKRLISKLKKQQQNLHSAWDLPPPAIAPQDESTSQRPSSQMGPAQPSPRHGIRPRIMNEQSPLLDTPANRLYLTPEDYSALHNGDNVPNSIPMQPLDPKCNTREQQKLQFFNWMNHQTDKANKYYGLMVVEAQTKLKMLEDQFAYFDKHRKAHNDSKSQLNRQRKVTTTFLAKLDLPSLPQIFKYSTELGRCPTQQHSAHNHSIKSAHVTDFNLKYGQVSYYQAKSMLKNSLMVFFHSLLQLQSFRQLNETAMRKIIKKFDKKLKYDTLSKYWNETKNISLRSSATLDSMIHEVETLFATEFTKGNHKIAVNTLRDPLLKDNKTYNSCVLFSGIALGATIPLLVLGLYAALRNQNITPAETNYLLQIYGAFSLIALFLIGFACCLTCWKYYRINTPFILELDQTSVLDFREFIVLPSLFAFGLGLFGWLTFNTPQSFHRYYPCLYLGISCVVLVLPTSVFYGASRRWLLHALWRLVFSGFYSVEFRDLLMGDIMCSLTYCLSTMELFFCIYATPRWWEGKGAIHAQRCTSSRSRSLGFLNCLPGIWRFLQCMRRYGDTLDWFPHLPNAGKYSFNILYNMTLSLARINPEHNGYRALFTVFALINGLYSGLWDIFMDFSLSPTKELREILVFPRWSYWAIMVIDFLMRQCWILYVVFWKYKMQGAKFSFIVALIEAVRRILWVAFRIENEHASNIASCRAFKDLALPYDINTELKSQCNIPSSSDDPRDWEPPNVTTSSPTASRKASSSSPSAHNRKQQPTLSNHISPVQRVIMPTKSPSSRSFSFSPRLQHAHTSDFQRRAPKRIEDEEEEDDDDDDDDSD